MIPKPYIAKWKDHAPWTTNEQVEQDLIISRALVALFSFGRIDNKIGFKFRELSLSNWISRKL